MKVVYLGNFSVPYSTESHLKWTWEHLGHQVVALQEGPGTSVDQVLQACQGADLWQVSHTHGWTIRGDVNGMMSALKARRIPTVSYHLDVYAGLNQWDRRESRVGQTWDWKVDYFFSTEGSKGEFFKSRGVNFHYLPPAVVEYGCFKGTFQPQQACDVLFAGSANYHPEYPFRLQMVEALKKRYGQRLRLAQGVREKALNDLYASAKVVVGDHCFAGVPFYWSDRLPETVGRGGFIVYPRTEGITIPVAQYEPQNLGDLIAKVDYYLNHEGDRERLRDLGFEHVKEYDTYTNRCRTILAVMGLA